MEKTKLEHFRKVLQERRQTLQNTMTTKVKDGRNADAEAANDIADRASNSYQKEFLFHQSNADRQLLNMVEGALARINDGSFGQCISCGEQINPKRLEAVPWTRHCIACQEKLERGELAQT